MLVSLVCLLHCADMKQVLLVDQEGLRDRQVQNAVLRSAMMGFGLFCLHHV